MDSIGILRFVAALGAFACVTFALPAAVATFGRLRAAARVSRDAAYGRDGLAGRLLRNGIAPATSVARVLSRNRLAAAYGNRVCWLARHRGYRTDPDRVGGVVLAAALFALVAGWLAAGSPVFGMMIASCLVIGIGFGAQQARERWTESMREAVPDAMHAMSACFHAGYSLLQTFRHLAVEAPGSLGALFRRAAGDLETGSSVEAALGRMRRESTLSELAFVTAALDIQHQTGGSMQGILDAACESVEGQLALRRSLRVQTAQARLSMRIVTIMPFVLVAVFSFVSPGFLAPFFASPLGVAALCIALGMQVAGILSVRRMLDVREA